MVDILSTMTQEELKYLKLQYEVAFKYNELLKMRKEIIGVSQKDDFYAYDIDNIVKASYNIIDILEVGDIISFYEDIDNYKKQYVIGIPDLITLEEIKDKITDDSIMLVSILTKEQMEQVAYKVEE